MRTPSLATLLLFLSAIAHADDPVARDFARNQGALPNALLAAGQARFGDLDLSRYLERLPELRVNVVGQVAHEDSNLGFTTERDSAEWNRQRKTIAVNGPHWQKTQGRAKPMLALHESLGAMGIQDQHFGCSGTLWILANPQARATLTREELADFEGFANKACVVASLEGGGSSTGVTGGGDDFNVLFRMNLFNKSLAKMRRAPDAASRGAALSYIEGNFYNEIGINPHKPIFDMEEFKRSMKFNPKPVPGSIRVVYRGQTIPEDAANGWTYEESTGTVYFHGTTIPRKGENEGPMVFYKKQR